MTVRTSSPAARARARLFVSSRRPDDELVGGQHQLRGDAARRLRGGLRKKPPAPVALGLERRFRLERHHGRDDSVEAISVAGSPTRSVIAKVTRTPEIAARLIAAALLDRIQHVADAFALRA